MSFNVFYSVFRNPGMWSAGGGPPRKKMNRLEKCARGFATAALFILAIPVGTIELPIAILGLLISLFIRRQPKWACFPLADRVFKASYDVWHPEL